MRAEIAPRSHREYAENSPRSRLRVADYDEPVLRPRKRHVEAPRIIEEADALRLVRADAREYNVVLLPTLEGVDRGDLDLRVPMLLQRACERTPPRELCWPPRGFETLPGFRDPYTPFFSK